MDLSYKSKASIFGIVIGIIVLFVGLSTTVPDRSLPRLASERATSGDDEGTHRYVGGDAYNFIIESSIRGGEIAGATAARAIFVSSGLLIIVIGGISLGGSLMTDEKKTKVVLPVAGSPVSSEGSPLTVEPTVTVRPSATEEPVVSASSPVTAEPVASEGALAASNSEVSE